MKHFALTGGIGSGKSKVLGLFENLGIPCFSADVTAKKLMQEDQYIISAVNSLFDGKAYTNGRFNRDYVAEQAFSSPELLKNLNRIVHPAVQREYDQWKFNQHAPYTIYEAAIIFEHHRQDYFDGVILVIAPEEERIRRVMNRDKASEESVRNRMANQWHDAKKIPLATEIIRNETWSETTDHVNVLHQRLLKNTGV
ncbi:MAG: dephospho-CoA kinase [Flavobacteriaceae bacterium]|nr:dephospho-CoA kinase [Flavobacteriaceae bacterium]